MQFLHICSAVSSFYIYIPCSHSCCCKDEIYFAHIGCNVISFYVDLNQTMFKCTKGVSQLEKPFLSIRAVMRTRNFNIILGGVSELFTSYAYTYVCTSIPEIGYLTKVVLHLCGMVIGLSQWGRKLPVNLVEA